MLLLRRRRLRLSGLAVMVIELGILTSVATAGEGIRDMIVLAYPIILTFGGLALDRPFFRLCVALTLGAVCWLALGEHYGLFVPKPFLASDWLYLIGVLVILVFTAFAVNLLAANMRRGLERARAEIAQRASAEASLDEERLLLRTLIDSLPDRIYVMDAKGSKILSNTADWQASGGETMQDVIGKTDFDTYPQDLAAQFQAVDQQVLTSGEPVIGHEEPGLDPDGKPVVILTSKVPLRNTRGEIVGLVGSGHDITIRKRSELIQSAIHRISQVAIASGAAEELYQSIHSILRELIPTDNFYIALYDPVTGMISFPYFVDQVDEMPAGPTKLQGPTGYVIRTGSPLLATREVFDRLLKQGEIEAAGTVGESWMGVPLKAEGRTIGIMAMKSYQQGVQFSQEDLNLLEFVSTQVAQSMERKRMAEEIRNLSLTDELTGLYNRRGFSLLAEQELKLARRMKREVLLIFCDLDGLKMINDTLGHAEGDLALKGISAILKGSFREMDILARFGGDEFVVLAVDASMESAEVLTTRLQTALEKRNQHTDRSYQLSLSMGIAHFDPESPRSVSELIAEADGLMYEQKQAKKRKN
jgi:diguanylate cyclase (GGDEF)-like protein/PAS domain S-box-containing protein